MRKALATLALAALAAAGAGSASAELALESVAWQQGEPQRPPLPPKFKDAERISLPAKGKPRLRGKAVLKNRGPRPAEGVLLRYALTARILPAAAPAGAEGAWAVPFLVEERRVPKVGPNQIVEVPLDMSPQLENHLKRVARQGFRVDRLRFQAMLEPHLAGASVKALESVLEVAP